MHYSGTVSLNKAVLWASCDAFTFHRDFSVQLASESRRWQSCVRVDDTKGQKYSWNDSPQYNDS